LLSEAFFSVLVVWPAKLTRGTCKKWKIRTPFMCATGCTPPPGLRFEARETPPRIGSLSFSDYAPQFLTAQGGLSRECWSADKTEIPDVHVPSLVGATPTAHWKPPGADIDGPRVCHCAAAEIGTWSAMFVLSAWGAVRRSDPRIGLSLKCLYYFQRRSGIRFMNLLIGS